MDNTNTKRRTAGKALLGAAVIALPMTASISYAASEAPLPPAYPEAPSVSVAPPAFPAAPAAPLPPEPPTAPLVDDQIIVIDPDGEVSGVDTNSGNVFVWNSQDGDNDTRVIVRNDDKSARFFDRSEFLRSSEMSKERLAKLLERSENSRLVLRNRSNSVRFFDRSDLDSQGQLSEEQIEEILEEVREGLEEANQVLEELPEIIEKAQAEAEAARVSAGRTQVRVESSCKGNDGEIVTETKGDDGVQIIRICQKRVRAQALEGLREARRSIKESDMDGNTRNSALHEIDRVISRWERSARVDRVTSGWERRAYQTGRVD